MSLCNNSKGDRYQELSKQWIKARDDLRLSGWLLNTMKDSLVGYQSLIVFAKCELVGVSLSMQTRHYLLGFHTTCPSGGTDSFGVGLRLGEVVSFWVCEWGYATWKSVCSSLKSGIYLGKYFSTLYICDFNLYVFHFKIALSTKQQPLIRSETILFTCVSFDRYDWWVFVVWNRKPLIVSETIFRLSTNVWPSDQESLTYFYVMLYRCTSILKATHLGYCLWASHMLVFVNEHPFGIKKEKKKRKKVLNEAQYCNSNSLGAPANVSWRCARCWARKLGQKTWPVEPTMSWFWNCVM